MLFLFCILLYSYCACWSASALFFFFFNDTATTEIYTLPYTTLFRSLEHPQVLRHRGTAYRQLAGQLDDRAWAFQQRSEEHTSELQSQSNLVCRLLLEKKKRHNHFILFASQTRRTVIELTPAQRQSIL